MSSRKIFTIYSLLGRHEIEKKNKPDKIPHLNGIHLIFESKIKEEKG
jgi:hypothetical protein